jgi:hypothetical protein
MQQSWCRSPSAAAGGVAGAHGEAVCQEAGTPSQACRVVSGFVARPPGNLLPEASGSQLQSTGALVWTSPRCALRKLFKGLTSVPRVIITAKLKSHGAAQSEMLPGVEHRQQWYLNNRAENSHQRTRQRERRTCRGADLPGMRNASSPRQDTRCEARSQ